MHDTATAAIVAALDELDPCGPADSWLGPLAGAGFGPFRRDGRPATLPARVFFAELATGHRQKGHVLRRWLGILDVRDMTLGRTAVGDPEARFHLRGTVMVQGCAVRAVVGARFDERSDADRDHLALIEAAIDSADPGALVEGLANLDHPAGLCRPDCT
uniref:hypothetical protein n=1 Tax=Amycolatopsis sp. CA-096443 TaxID=3239919 RepID=UPI003F499A1A